MDTYKLRIPSHVCITYIYIWIYSSGAIKLQMASWYKRHSVFTRNKSLSQALFLSPGSCEDRACAIFRGKEEPESYKSRRDTGANVRGRALQQATTVTTLLKRRESSFVWYFRYIKPRICDSGAEFGLAKLHFTARGRIPGYINLYAGAPWRERERLRASLPPSPIDFLPREGCTPRYYFAFSPAHRECRCVSILIESSHLSCRRYLIQDLASCEWHVIYGAIVYNAFCG